MNPLSRGDPDFGTYDRFDPEAEPAPGPFLAEHDVLSGRTHAAVHRLARALFADRGVYDMTFGYNLARLNLDERHPDAGFRYAVEVGGPGRDGDGAHDDRDDPLPGGDDRRVLRTEFTPTTAFCPQSDTLTKGAFRAWNGCRGRHEYGLVRVRVAPDHDAAADINDELAALERRFAGAGVLPEEGAEGGRGPVGSEAGFDDGMAGESTGGGSDAPF
jgi:hypothetical protein